MKQYFTGIFLLLSIQVFSQNLPKITSLKTPEASSIDQVIEVPVSYFTGVPQINIPLYEINLKGISVPITLDYNAGGIRVDQEATVVGLGWTLNYGGQISRSVKGKPDEYSFFNAGRIGWNQNSIQHFLDLPDVKEDANMLQRYEYNNYAKMGATLYDYRPDEFNYSGQGFSGRFMYNQPQNKFVFFPREDIKVDYTYASTMQIGSAPNFYPIESWLMTLPTGTTIKYGLDGVSKSGTGNGLPATGTDVWKVKEIKNVTGQTVTFTHTPVVYSAPNVVSDEYSDNTKQVTRGAWAVYNYEEGVIQTISFPNGTVNFQLMDRLDMPTGAKAIQSITVLDTHGRLIRKITFSYSYFSGTTGDISVSDYLITSDVDHKRLKLDKLTITGTDGVPRVYSFAYITKGVTPSKKSFSQDIWGYFNGKTNTTWVPRILLDQEVSANRSVDPFYTDIFTLKSITYPTGGKTEYAYEANQAQADVSSAVLIEMNAPAMKSVGWGITLYGSNRLEYGRAPTNTGPFGEKYFRKSFTVPSSGGLSVKGGWFCSTDFYRNNEKDNLLDCYNYNVYFILERVNSDGTFTTIKMHRLRECSLQNEYRGTDYGTLPYLDPGNYRMSVVIWYTNLAAYLDQGHVTNFGVYWGERVDPQQQPQQAFLYAGGIRVKSIKYKDSDGALLREKQYSYKMPGSELTSGKIVSFPCYVQNFMCKGDEGTEHCFGTGGINSQFCTDVHISGSPVYGIQTTSGSTLGYQYVTEKVIGDTETGDISTQYFFSFVDPIYNSYYRTIQEGIREPREWQRGKLLSMVMTKNGVITKSEVNEYYDFAPHLQDQEGEDYVVEINTDLISDALTSKDQPMKPGFYDVFNTGLLLNGKPWLASYWFYNVSDADLPQDIQSAVGDFDLSSTIPIPYHQTLPYFKRYSGFDKLKKKITDTYDDAGHRVRVIEEFDYSATPVHHQLTATRSTNSNGEQTLFETRYPTNFSTTAPYSTMITKNMVAVPVEEVVTRGGVTQSVKTNYASFGTRILPGVVQSKDGASNYEDRFEYLSYDIAGNATALKRSSDVKYVYLYGYRNQYLLAEAQDIETADLAFANFEDGVTDMNPGNWSLSGSAYVTDATSPFGTSCYVLGGSIYMQKTGLTASREYIISYWSKNGSYAVTGSTSVTTGATENGWTFYTHTVSGVTSLMIQTTSGTGRIDEVKLYPKNAMIKTYSYRELVGVTSVTDANNITTYYDYDGTGRLLYIRDKDKNILKVFEYQYHNGN